MTRVAPATDYERYIRTDELLALQKPAESLSCHDELQFQIVHQVAELWMKLVEHELIGPGGVVDQLRAVRTAEAMRGLQRVDEIQRLLLLQLDLLDTMPPRHYMTIRTALGRGSGQESPGFKRMCQIPNEVWIAFEGYLEARRTSLRQIHENPERHADELALVEALIDYDQGLQIWRQRHLMLVFRQIGTGTPSLKGKPSELLAEGMKHRFFPKLWDVRDELFAEWTRAHPTGATSGYHG